MRANISNLLIVAALALTATAAATAADDLNILTWPTQLAAGTMEVEVDLGASGQPAELYLDGDLACTATTTDARCTVDLGLGLHVHLLELIRRTADGSVERVERWVNRPGFEAELRIQLATHPVGSTCGGRVTWADPHGSDPVALEITAAGQRRAVSSDGRTFAYPCADPGHARVVAVSAVFPDGRRAEAAVETNSTGHVAAPSPWPVALEATSPALDPCGAIEARLAGVRPVIGDDFEIVFVLDPRVDYRALAGLGTDGSDAANIKRSWQKASDSLADADGLWYVIPNHPPERVNGFSEGRETWLGGFFARGVEAGSDHPFLADAVAAAGLTAGAGPRRRAVVLVAGAGSGKDGSRFSPTQVGSYLAEIGVPLIVLESGAAAGSDWSDGVRVQSLATLADAFVAVRKRLDEQCVEWLPADMHPRAMAASLPAGIVVAGRLGEGAGQGTEVWRRAAVAQGVTTPISDEPVASELVEVTAVTVLVSAKDAKGRPVTDLRAEDLTVTEDGKIEPVLGLEPVQRLTAPAETPLPEPAAAQEVTTLPAKKIVPVAVYVERDLAGPADIAPALAAVAERADWLTGLGPVDVVVADQGVKTVLKGSVDAAQVRETLENLAAKAVRAHGIERIRTEYLRENRQYPNRGAAREGESVSSSVPDNLMRAKAMTSARQAIFQEDALLRKTMARMNDWALSLPAAGPRVLVTIGLGFDEDPSDFYIPFLEQKDPSLAASARAEFLNYHQATRVDHVGRELAAAGWLVVPVATRTLGSPRTGAEYSGGDRFQAFLTDHREGAYIRDVDYMLMDPLGSQAHLAAPSGGRVVMGGKGLDKLIAEASGWYRLTYQVARAPDGAYHDVVVVSKRPGVEVRGTGVVVSGTSEGRAAMRLRQLLEGSPDRGELPVKLLLGTPRHGEGKTSTADLSITVELGPIAPLFKENGRRALRFSVVVRSGESESEVVHRLATVEGAVAGFRYDVPLAWSKHEPSEVAVVVEDLGSGAWGGGVLEIGH